MIMQMGPKRLRHFATTELSPWAIAWLVKIDDWEHLERVIQRNCRLLGGYHNVVIPVSDDGTVSPTFEAFLFFFDPDYIILAPGMPEFGTDSWIASLNPYAVVAWDQVTQIIPADGSSGAAGSQAVWLLHASDFANRNNWGTRDLVAVTDDAFPDGSRLAFLACGDVSPSEPFWESWDAVVSLDASGYRESILRALALDGRQNDVLARLGPDDKVIPAPNRKQLASIIKDEHKFPLTGAVDILEACCAVQSGVGDHNSFIGRTAPQRGGTPIRRFDYRLQTPGMAILVSDHFEFHEAVLFWNLRANGVTASWLSFSQIERELTQILEWLDSDLGAGLFIHGTDIAFAASQDDQDRLHHVFAKLTSKRQSRYPEWKTLTYGALILYDYKRPYIQQRDVLINQEGSDCSFLPEYPQNTFGTLALTLEWPELMLPRRHSIARLISSARAGTWSPLVVSPEAVKPRLDLLRFRITLDRYARVQISNPINTPSSIQFNVPSVKAVLSALLDQAGFGEFRDAHHSQYQQVFVERSGSLEHACNLLQSSPYKEFFRLMSDTKKSQPAGWLVADLDRRALHQAAICKQMNRVLPDKTEDYFNCGDLLPEEAAHLIRLQLLERGFLLRCPFCSSTSWYQAEEVGQLFRCHRCYREQRIESNPLWLYKLPEVIFQGFKHNMDVPLLALGHLLRKSRQNFDYGLDSEVFIDKQNKRNIDFSCLSDGRLYVGEAKSNDVIENDQFDSYESLVTQLGVDGVVFATSEESWKPGTQGRIEALRSKFKGEVLILTKFELFEE
jgi:hypothetical protein